MQQPVTNSSWQRWAGMVIAASAGTCVWAVSHAGCGDGAGSAGAPASAEAGWDGDGVDEGDSGVDRDVDGLAEASAEDVTSDGGAEADAGWPLDPDGWIQLKDEFDWLEPCKLWKADLSKVAVPGLEWKSCGSGCETADVTGGISPTAYSSSGGDTLSNVPYAQVWTGTPGQPGPKEVARIVNLATGAALHAFRLDNVVEAGFTTCSAGRGMYSPPSVLNVKSSASLYVTLVWNPQTGAWTNTYPPGPRGATALLESVDGLVSIGAQADIYVSLSLRPPDFVKVFSGSAGPSPARGNQILFPDWRALTPGDHGRLASWTPATGVQTLYEGTDEPMTTALSDTHLVWVSVPDLQHADSGPDDLARFYWSPRAATPATIDVHAGAVIPNAPGYVDWQLKTHGDYAAVVSWIPAWSIPFDTVHDRWFTAVTQLSTGKLWMIKATRSDHTPAQVWAVSDTHVYVAEAPLAKTEATEVVRYEIDKLDALQAR